ncbi:hypothetical protein ACFE04_005460 [Oxalis oulophora]
MLLAVEGGGFFSSSATGYTKGLTLLFLGHNNDDNNNNTRMRVSPWNHYQLVDQLPDPDQLASAKTWRLSRACACFRRASTPLDTPSQLKGCPAQQKDVLPGSLIDDENCVRKDSLKSNLKKPSNNGARFSTESVNESLVETRNDISCYTEKRKVQWTDTCGSELVEIREFEPSEVDGSDDEMDNGNEKSCLCTIM